MKAPVLFVLFCTILSAVTSIRIFPLVNPPPVIESIDLKKYAGLTAGLLPGAFQTKTELGKVLSVSGNAIPLLEKDLVPPKVCIWSNLI